MPQKAHVVSVEALEEFRARLIVYLGQARSALEEVSAEVLRTRVWLQNEQRVHWEQQLRRRARNLEEAQAALFSARLSSLRSESAAEQMMVHRARRAVEEGEAKLRVIRTWDRDFESRVQPLVKQVEKLHTVLTNDMVKAVAYLGDAMRTLTAYAEIAVPAASAGPAQPAAPAAPEAPSAETTPSPAGATPGPAQT